VLTEDAPPDDDGEEGPDTKPFEDFIEVMKGFADDLGLYLISATGKMQSLDTYVMPGNDPVVKPFVYARFDIGEIAFSDRVQHPEKYTDEAMLAGIEQASLEEQARRIVQRYNETGELFGD
jgi:hypothetical protein